MAKITDASKLLPSAKSTAITKIGKANFTSPLKISKKSTSITKGLLGESNQKDSVDVNNKLVKVEKFFQSDLLVSKKKAETKRKEKEKEEFKKEEEKLEAPKEAKKFNLPSLSVPGMSFLDRIKRFLFFTALGWLFTKFQDQLPKLLGVVKLVTGVYGVAENIFKTLLTGLVDFIDIGYQTYDGLRKKVEDLGGKDAAKTFDDFSSHLNKLINGTLMVATLVASTAPKSPSAPSGAGIGIRPKPGPGQGGRPRITTSGGGGAGRPDIRNPLRQRPRITTSGGVSAAKVAPVAKGARFGAGRIPIVGPLITFGIRTLVYGEKPQKAAAAAVGMGIGQAIGTFIGTLGAGALGLGTAGLGAVVAPLIIGAGSVIGGLAGEWLGATLYDFVAGFGKNKKPQLKAAGGSVTRGGKPQGAGPSRTLKISKRRPPKVKPKQSQPGKDVGGKKKIRELYPDPSVRTDIEGEQKGAWWNLLPPLPENASAKQKSEREAKIKSLPNPYKALTNTAKVLKDIPFGIGALMGGAVDIALGQKLPKDAIRGLSGGISYLITSIANRQISASISNIEKEVSKMQTGGMIRAKDFTKGSEVGPGEGITKALDNLIYQKVDEAIREVQKQLMPGKYNEKTAGDAAGADGGAGGGAGPGSVDGGDFSGNTKATKAFNFFKSQGYTDYQAAAIVGNLIQENREMNPTLTNRIGMKGIAQWDANRWSNLEEFAASKKLDPNSFETQLQFIQKELKTGEGGLSEKTLKSTKTLEDATIIFRRQYERPSEAEAMDTKRIQYAKEVLSSSRKPSATTSFELVNPTPKTDISKNKGGYAADTGLDILGNIGDPIASPVDGILEYAEQGHTRQSNQDSDPNTPGFQPQYSFRIKLDKPFTYNGKTVNYVYGTHLSSLDSSVLNKSGIKIRKGQILGKMGQANNVPHLHIGFVTDREQNQFLNYREVREILTKKNTVDSPVQSGSPAPGQSAKSTQEIQKIKNNLVRSGDIPVTTNGKTYYLRVRPGDPPQVIQKGAGFLGTDQFIDISGGRNSSIRKAIDSKLSTYGVTLSDLESNRPAQPARPQQPPSQRSSGVTSGPGSSGYSGKQGGGIIPKQSPNRNVSSLRSYPSYSDGGMMIAIQPMIIEKPVPVPMGRGRGISFPIAGVNNSTGNTPSLNKG